MPAAINLNLTTAVTAPGWTDHEYQPRTHNTLGSGGLELGGLIFIIIITFNEERIQCFKVSTITLAMPVGQLRRGGAKSS